MHELKTLKEFIQSKDALLLLLGEAGNGKTELLEELVAEATPARPIVHLHGRQQIKPRFMIQNLSQHWNVPAEDHGEPLVEQLRTLLNGLIRKNHCASLLIDDAHLLPFSILAALVHIVAQQDATCHMHLVLAGRVSLEDKVRTLHEQAMRIIRLGRMPQHEARSHIEDFLDQTHITASQQAVDGIVERLYQQSHGVPSRIDKLLRELTLKDFMQPKVGKSPAKQSARPHHRFNVSQEAVLGERGARGFAVIALFATMFGLYWYEHHMPSVSPRLPAKPYHFAMIKPVPLQQTVKPPKAVTSPPAPVKVAMAVPLTQHHGYTIQLMGSFNKADVQQKLNSLHLVHAQIFQEQFKRKPWYILGLGNYATRHQAQQSLHNLPKQLRSSGAWIRPL